MDIGELKEYRSLLMLIVIGTIPTAIIAFALKSLFEFSFYDFFLLSIGFFISGVFIFITKFFKKAREVLISSMRFSLELPKDFLFSRAFLEVVSPYH